MPKRFDVLRDDVDERYFSPADATARGVGAEVELLVHDASTNRPLPLLGASRSVTSLLRRYAPRARWTEVAGYGAVPRFLIDGQAIVSFEPGGQIEISTEPRATASSLVDSLDAIVPPLVDFFANEGVELRSAGIDPFNDAPSIPQQLPVDRYERMTRYFEHIGPFGIRMMRQTAAIQVSLDRGDRPAERWRLLNDLAPYLTAIFASSPRHAGVETGHASYRAHCWRNLDLTRTGMAGADADPAGAYTRFALAANDMMRTEASGDYRPFEAWLLDDGDASRWGGHLSTLFPEVRPRGHFEVRSCDAVAPRWYAAPIVFLTGLTYDAHAAREATLLASDSLALLRSAGENGLRDVAIARTARDLFQLALAGARRLGGTYVHLRDLETAAEYYATYTGRDRAPADDQLLVVSPTFPATAALP